MNEYVGQEAEEARGEVQMEGFSTSSSMNRCPTKKTICIMTQTNKGVLRRKRENLHVSITERNGSITASTCISFLFSTLKSEQKRMC